MSKKTRILYIPPAEALAALDKMMAQDMQHNRTGFITTLIAQEYRRRKLDKSTGDNDQPDEIKDYSNDLPKNMPYFGRMVGPREYQDLKAAAIALKNELGLEAQG